jgi:hypothetical protein
MIENLRRYVCSIVNKQIIESWRGLADKGASPCAAGSSLITFVSETSDGKI